jgi:hypothetical protein
MAPKKQPMTAAFLKGGNLAVAGAQWWNTRRLDGRGTAEEHCDAGRSKVRPATARPVRRSEQ